MRTGAASLAPGTRDFEGSGARNAYIGNPGLLRAVEHRTRLIPKAEKSGRSDRLLAPPPPPLPLPRIASNEAEESTLIVLVAASKRDVYFISLKDRFGTARS